MDSMIGACRPRDVAHNGGRRGGMTGWLRAMLARVAMTWRTARRLRRDRRALGRLSDVMLRDVGLDPAARHHW